MSNNRFDWCDFWNLGNSYSNENDKAKLRTAISRFYFSSFCISRNHLLKNNIFLDKNSKKIMNSNSSRVHNETRRIFKNHPQLNYNRTGVKIAEQLNDLREYRNMADYDDENPKNLKFAYKSCKSKSKRIFSLLNELN